MTPMIKQKAAYVFDANTSVDFMEGWPEFIKELVRHILERRWAKKIASMSDGEILDEYYRLTQRGESDDYIISKAVIRDPEE